MTLKATLALATLALGLLPTTGMVAHAAAGAADTTQDTASQTAERQATVDVQPGDLKFQTKDGLAVTPSFNFESAKVTDQAQPELKPTGSTIDTSYTLGVSNFLGGAAWQVSAQLGAFDDKHGHNLKGAFLHLKGEEVNSKGKPLSAAPSANLTAGGPSAVFLDARTDEAMGKVTDSLANTTLELPNVDYAGTYTAKLTYTLTTGPQEAQTTPTSQPSTQH
ncbi:hypothetical protein FD38_GL000626 [Levilactobacillus zymae DSM 19395]|nr:WxL domain-containing protein [Levilactobacillus zymae]KRL15623.1 hypothetical protein FD38_GL000626 [Levilactobacillus zymae DSM 19395]QFR60711.1 hypothetical protein LZ395_03845 [Levilactobacillus zymae]